MSRPGRPHAAATASATAGVGFGIPCLVGIQHLSTTGDVWYFLGFPTYGDGPFERIGLPTTVPLLVGFLAVCAAEIALAGAIIRRSLWVPRANAALLLFEIAYWIGFALPFGFALGIGRSLLLRHGNPWEAVHTSRDSVAPHEGRSRVVANARLSRFRAAICAGSGSGR